MFMTKWFFSKVRPFVERFPRIASMYRNLRDQSDFLDEPRSTPWGFKLAGHKSMASGKFEPIETELVRNILNDVDVLVNVGANVGYYCCHAMSLGKSIIAFEPIQRNYRYLLKNIQSNGWSSGAEVFQLALSDKVGVLEIYGGGTGASLVKGWSGTPDNYMTLASSSTMDIVLGTRLAGKRALILVDIEGAEGWMLEGASLMLTNKPRPIWLMEIMSKDHQPSGTVLNPMFLKIFHMFFNYGYQAFNAGQNMQPITIEDVELISNGELEVSSHNFLFR